MKIGYPRTFRDWYAILLLVAALFMWTRPDLASDDIRLLIAGGLLTQVGMVVTFYFRKSGPTEPTP